MAEERRFFISPEEVAEDEAILSGEEFNHLANVLRLRPGDEVVLLPGGGEEYSAVVREVSKRHAVLSVTGFKLTENEPKTQLDLFCGLTKGERMDYTVQKCVELGVRRVVPFTSCYTVAKGTPERTQRLQRIADEAVKQCGRAVRVPVEEARELSVLLPLLSEYDAAVFFSEREKSKALKALAPKLSRAQRVAVIVGAEGGFSEQEAEEIAKNGGAPVSLGPRILRAETAAAVAVALVQYELRELQPRSGNNLL